MSRARPMMVAVCNARSAGLDTMHSALTPFFLSQCPVSYASWMPLAFRLRSISCMPCSAQLDLACLKRNSVFTGMNGLSGSKNNPYRPGSCFPKMNLAVQSCFLADRQKASSSERLISCMSSPCSLICRSIWVKRPMNFLLVRSSADSGSIFRKRA